MYKPQSENTEKVNEKVNYDLGFVRIFDNISYCFWFNNTTP